MTYASEVLADSPLLYWKLDEATSSTTAVDASGNGRDGTASAWTFRQASKLPGSSYGSTPTSTSGTVTSPSISFGTSHFTVEMWVDFNSTTGTYMLFAVSTHYLGLYVNASKLGVNTANGDQYGCALPGSGVHHIVVVMPNNQSTTNTTIYIDGVSQTLSQTGPASSAPSVGTATFNVSNSPLGGLGVPNGVYIDEVAVYSGTLSSSRVVAHYSAGLTSTDLFANAAPLQLGVTRAISTTGFGTEASEPLTCPVAATAWLTFTPTHDGVYQIDTIGSNYDTGLSVYTGTALANLARLAYDDDSGGSTTSRLVLELIAGVQYYVQAGAGPSAGTTTGALLVSVTSTSAYNGWGSGSLSPGTANANQINAGTAFYTTLPGQKCVGARIFLPSGVTGDRTGAVGYLYAAGSGYPSGSALATATFPTLTKGVWTEVRWAGVALTAGTTYYIVAYMKANLCCTIANQFNGERTAPSGASGLVFAADTSAHHNGVYADNTSPGTLPSSNFSAEFLCVDVILDGGITAGWK
jgi:hypothetical protein